MTKMRPLCVLALVLGLAEVCQAQPIRSVCVMPVLADSSKAAVTEWLMARGLQVVDCMKGPGAGDAVLGFYANTVSVVTSEYAFYRTGNEITIYQNTVPASGLTIWLQSHKQGQKLGNIFVGDMVYYGHARNLEVGLKRVLKAIRKENK